MILIVVCEDQRPQDQSRPDEPCIVCGEYVDPTIPCPVCAEMADTFPHGFPYKTVRPARSRHVAGATSSRTRSLSGEVVECWTRSDTPGVYFATRKAALAYGSAV